MERKGLSRAELARRMKVSRARITQVMNLLKLSPEIIEMIKEMGDRFERQVITERKLREIEKERAGRQVEMVERW